MNNVDFNWKDLLIILVITFIMYSIGLLVKKKHGRNFWSWKFSYGINMAICSTLSIQAYNNYSKDKPMFYIMVVLAIILFIYTVLFGKKMMKKEKQSEK